MPKRLQLANGKEKPVAWLKVETKIQEQLTGLPRKISNPSKERWSIWFPCKSTICCMYKSQNVISKEINFEYILCQCSPEKFHVNCSMEPIFRLEEIQRSELDIICVQNYKSQSSISFKVLTISSTLKDMNSSCSLISLRIMHSCCWNAADRSLSRWSSWYKSWIFLSFSSCKHGWTYQS